MASKIQIYNMALGHIGMKKLFDTTTSNPSLEACELNYVEALKDTFSEHAWSFATVIEQFAQVSTTVVGWDYVYAYPTKAAIVNYVYSESNYKYKEEKEFEVIFLPSSNKRVICSNEAEAYIDYTYVLEDTTLFSPKFTLAASFKLAAYIAHQLTGDPNLSMVMRTYADAIIQEAKRINFKEKIKRPEQSNTIVDSRA